jgi:phosphoribosyl 1,2-cyclic phosphodiesterase
VPVQLTILGSGSAGNSAYVEAGEVRILVDAGLSARQIRLRLAAIGRAPEKLDAILITHEHSDHTQGLAALAKKLRLPVYCNRPTRDEIARALDVPLDFRIFETGKSFEIGDVLVESFSIPHDAQDPVGFLLHTSTAHLGFITDLGHVTKLVVQRARAANVLVLEANHDVKMLQECPHRPWSLKQRILGRHGHLSNEDAAAALEEILTADLRHLYLGHLSRECNRPELALRVVQEKLGALGAGHVALNLTSQNVSCPTLAL